MADDITIPASGTGTATPKVATDDVSGSHYQRVKLDLGANGASSPAVGTVPVSGTVTVTEPVSVDDNGGSLTVDGTVAVSNHPTTIDVGNFPATQPVSGTVTANAGTGPFPVSDNGGSLTVDGSVAVSGTVTVDGSGATQPVSHAALTELAAAIDTELQVDVVGALPAGNNNIGDVDIASMPNVTLNEPVTVDGTITASNLTGNVAHDSPDSGNPVKIGGVASSAFPAEVADGDRANLWLNSRGAAMVSGGFVGGSDGIIGSVGLHADDGQPYPVGTTGYVYNGLTWDRQRGDTLGMHVSRSATAATATLSNVNDTNVSTTLLSSNTSRKGATIHNDSTAILYVKFGTTASATSYTVKLVADAYYEVPFGYTGRIDGIWASDASGAARITEMT